MLCSRRVARAATAAAASRTDAGWSQVRGGAYAIISVRGKDKELEILTRLRRSQLGGAPAAPCSMLLSSVVMRRWSRLPKELGPPSSEDLLCARRG